MKPKIVGTPVGMMRTQRRWNAEAWTGLEQTEAIWRYDA